MPQQVLRKTEKQQHLLVVDLQGTSPPKKNQQEQGTGGLGKGQIFENLAQFFFGPHIQEAEPRPGVGSGLIRPVGFGAESG